MRAGRIRAKGTRSRFPGRTCTTCRRRSSATGARSALDTGHHVPTFRFPPELKVVVVGVLDPRPAEDGAPLERRSLRRGQEQLILPDDDYSHARRLVAGRIDRADHELIFPTRREAAVPRRRPAAPVHDCLGVAVLAGRAGDLDAVEVRVRRIDPPERDRLTPLERPSHLGHVRRRRVVRIGSLRSGCRVAGAESDDNHGARLCTWRQRRRGRGRRSGGGRAGARGRRLGSRAGSRRRALSWWPAPSWCPGRSSSPDRWWSSYRGRWWSSCRGRWRSSRGRWSWSCRWEVEPVSVVSVGMIPSGLPVAMEDATAKPARPARTRTRKRRRRVMVSLSRSGR